jgi:hypothetical protein
MCNIPTIHAFRGKAVVLGKELFYPLGLRRRSLCEKTLRLRQWTDSLTSEHKDKIGFKVNFLFNFEYANKRILLQ